MTTKTDITLLPCPFCGCNTIYTEPDEVGSGGQWVSPIHVGCNKCKAEQMGDDEPAARANWNRRAAVEADRKRRGEPVGITPIADMCRILKEHYVEEVERTDCTILYTVTFDQLRAIYDRGRKEAPQPAEPVKVPSDDDLLGCAGVTRQLYGGMPMIIGTTDIRRFADCVRKHWGSSQPATPDWPSINAIIAATFGDDSANAARAQSVVAQVFATGGQPAAQAQPNISLNDDDLDRVATILNRHEAEEIGLWGVVEEIMDAFGARFYPTAQDLEDAEHRGYARAEAENVGYRTDAQRYRWLRDRNGVNGGRVEIFIDDEAYAPGHLDMQIDAARAARGGDHD